MPERHCRCTHPEGRHERVEDREGIMVSHGRCLEPDCGCKRYIFDYERWIRADERRKFMEDGMDAMEIRRKLEQALKIDDSGDPIYLNLEDKDEQLSLSAFRTRDQAEAQRELVIQSLVRILS